MKNLKTGFSLVEIVVVVGIITLIASLAVPNLIRARINANNSIAYFMSTVQSIFDQNLDTMGPRSRWHGIAPGSQSTVADDALAPLQSAAQIQKDWIINHFTAASVI